MAKMTKEQQSQIKLLTRRANRRIERASSGQRRAMEFYIGGEKFSAPLALSLLSAAVMTAHFILRLSRNSRNN